MRLGPCRRREWWRRCCAGLGIASCLGASSLVAADPTEFRLRRAWSLFGRDPGQGGLFAADLDLDGRPDLVTSAALPYNDERHDWYQVRLLDSTFEVTWGSLFHDNGNGRFAIGSAYGLPAVAISTWFDVLVYSGPTKELVQVIPVEQSDLSALLLADLDADGDEELVACDTYDLFVYDLRTAAEQGLRLGFGCTGLDVGQLDDDPPLELVVSGSPLGGFVMDGASLDVEWADTRGFGAVARVADLEGDGLGEILAGTYSGDSMRALDPRSESTFWEIPAVDLIAMVPAEVDADPEPELVALDGSSIVSLNAESGETLFSIPLPAPANGVAVADFDSNGSTEIVVAGGTSGRFEAYDVHSRALVAGSNSWESLVGTFRVADVDANGRVEVAVAVSGTPFPATDQRSIFVPASPAIPLRYGPPNSFGDVTALGIGQLDQDPAKEYCVANDWNAHIACFDGLDHSFQWEIALEGVSRFHLIASGPVDSDPEDELILALDGLRLVAIAAESAEVLWELEVPPDLFGEFYGLRIANFDTDPGLEIALAPNAFRLLWGGRMLIVDLQTGAIVAGPHDEIVTSFDVYSTVAGTPDSLVVITEAGIALMNPLTGETGSTIVATDEIYQVSAADLTRDGVPDLVATHPWELRAYDGTDGTEIWRSPLLSVPVDGDALLARDFDRDTIPEILASTIAGLAWFDAPLLPVFRDGFETGTYGAWSHVEP